MREDRPRQIFFGWKVVAVTSLVAFFGFGSGFYSQGVYLVVLHERHGWPIAFISLAITVYFVLGAAITAFVGDALERFGPRTVVLVAVAALGAGVLALPRLERPWHLYVAFAVMAVGWGGTSGAAINALVAPWFEKKRGLAVSIAFNGATAGGVIMVPLWTALIAAIGFSSAASIVVGVMVATLVPLAARYLYRRPEVLGLHPDGAAEPAPTRGPGGVTSLRRADLIRSRNFWTISAPFALGLLAQVGFLTHQMAYVKPRLGAEGAALAVSLTTFAAIVGRLLTGLFIDRVDRRVAASCNFILQAVAVIVMISWPSTALLYAAGALFGLGLGNAVTFPALIVQMEYPKEHFSRIVSLIVAINQFTFAFGPGLLGWLRDWSGSYSTALGLCIVCEAMAAIVVLVRRRPG